MNIRYEVWKIWTLYDVDESGTLEFEELKYYIQEMAFQHLNLTDEQIRDVFNIIDKDSTGEIDKEEMHLFLNLLLTL